MISYFTLYKPLFVLELLIAEGLYAARLRRRKRFLLRAGLSVLFCLAVSAIPWHPKAPLELAGAFLLLFLLSCGALLCCFDAPPASILFCALAGYNTQHFSYCAGNIPGLLINPKNSISGLYTDQLLEAGALPLESYLALSAAFLVTYLSYYAFYHLFARRIEKGTAPVLRSRSLLGISLLSVLVSIVVNAFLVFSRADVHLTLVISVYNAVCCLFITFMLFSLMDRRKMADELEKIRNLLDRSREQYAQSRRNIELINIKCHDLKHQIRKIGEANRINEDALREMSEAISIYDSEVETGNPALDTILTEKSLYCHKNRIRLQCMADGNVLRFMNEAEIYSLFGNALDNAIRAVRHIAEEERRVIGVNVNRVRQFATIQIRNYYEDRLLFAEGELPETTKKDRENHGLGLKSIQYIVEKYRGTLSVQPEENVFNLNIMIPLPEREKEKML